MRIGLSCKEPLMGEALACLLESRRSWSVSFVAPTVGEAVAVMRQGSVDLLIVDTLGIEAEDLQRAVELRAMGVSVVLLVAEANLNAYLDLPVDRVISRRGTADETFALLDEMVRPAGRARAGSLPFDLSRRELECAQLVSRGLSNRRIAEMTGLREQSVKNVVSLAMRKLGVDNRVQIALRLGVAAGPSATPSSVTHAVVSLSVPSSASLESVGAAAE